jgi:hypothetical protein
MEDYKKKVRTNQRNSTRAWYCGPGSFEKKDLVYLPKDVISQRYKAHGSGKN